MYIKPEVKKKDTTAMNTPLMEVCIGLLHEIYYLGRRIFLVLEMSNFFAAEWDFPPIYMVSPKRLGKG